MYARTPSLGVFIYFLTGTQGLYAPIGSNGRDGEKVIVVRSGGKLEVHGKPKVPWTRLQGTVGPFGRRDREHTINLAEPVNWEQGDQIVIASTDFSPFQAETFTIENCTNTECNINGRMKFQHFGAIGNDTFIYFIPSFLLQPLSFSSC